MLPQKFPPKALTERRRKLSKICGYSLLVLSAIGWTLLAQDLIKSHSSLPTAHAARDSGLAKDVSLWKKAAVQEDARAQDELGGFYLQHQNYGKALKWYHRAALQGDADGEVQLGALYSGGIGVPQNYKKSVAWYRKAAAQGNAGGESGLGDMFAQGLGEPRDYAKALFWYRKSAAQGNADAENGLGMLYANGLAVPQNYSLAMHYYQKAAAGGYAMAMRNIGLLYAYGHGVSRNVSIAQGWLQRAVAAGDTGAKPFLPLVEQEMIVNLLSWLALAAIIAGAVWVVWRRYHSSNGDGAAKREVVDLARDQRWGNMWILILILCELAITFPMLIGSDPLLRHVVNLMVLLAFIMLVPWVYRTAKRVGARATWLLVLFTFVPVVNLLALLLLRSKANKRLKAAGFKFGFMGVNSAEIAAAVERDKCHADAG